MERRFYTLDVFTTTRFEGNPLAVITDGDGLSDEAMLAIAREMNLSETVFVQKPTEDSALARLRIFTTQEELKLAGHPVIGTWFLLAELGVVPAQEGGVHVSQQTGAGVLPVEIRFKEGRPQRVTMTQLEAKFRPAKINKKALSAALGLAAKDLDPKLQPEFVSTGHFNLLVPLKNRAALAKIQMNPIALSKVLGKNGAMAYCFTTNGGNGKVFSRGMLPWEQYEDAATGSAAGSLGAYLVRHGKLTAGHTLNILQGEEMGRPSHIEVEVTQAGKKLVPRVSGAAVQVFAGTIGGF
jgi:trans-2,3-dihydro-3-hydroxyanthranilate isomerase